MRFAMLMIPRVYQGGRAEEGFTPSADAVEKMMKYNEELAKAGVLVALDGLHPPSEAVRVSFPDGKATPSTGPFPESKEVVGGYWIIKAGSKEEAAEWASKVPAEDGDIVEVRQIFEMNEFPEEVQKAAESEVVKAAIGS